MSKATDYDKLKPREHVLKRPDTYIGDIELTYEEMDIYDDTSDSIISKKINYVPGFMKCFDELLVNSRDASENDKTCDTIKIDYNTDENYIRVWNNGQNGIPVEEHPKFKTLVPSMIFGELHTSSNYDDSKKRTTGGRNGYGAKLANIFSTRFEVEIGDSNNGKKFKQAWISNMSTAEKAKVTKYSQNNSYISITFYPDLEKFGLDSMDNDHLALFYRRAIDISAVSSGKLKVHFNNNLIKTNTFKKYIQSYYPETDIYYDVNERWEVSCIYIPDSNNKVVSFVNGISTYRGGTHVNHVMDQVFKPLINNYIKKKDKEIKISPSLLKDNLVFFINATINNPSFNSQTKDTLTTKTNQLGSTYKPSEAFLKKLAKCGIVNQVIQLAKFKESSQLKKNDGKKQVRLRGIPKLEDANKAGSKDSTKCALILTEGDSAKAFAMAGLGMIGRDYFGVFPLKGKLLNVREASVKQQINNDEINHLKQIIGLKQDVTYSDDEDFKTLRYGKVICLTDQDTDGSHIKGLLINFFHHLWPKLIERKGFITSLATPIVKGFKGKEEKIFYNLTEYDTWKESGDSKGWKIKYYKGLGTSTSKEAKEYFVGFDDKLIRYFCTAATEGMKKSVADECITLAFDKSRTNDRKKWLMDYDKNNILTYEEREVSYNDFIHKDMKHFSNDDTARSIPHIMDGLKPSQRKILYGALLRGLDKTEVKVAQLAGFVSDKAAYHHGEMSLTGAIVGMAQNFIGSNNINILKPNGQFGTRLQGGKDAASPRYIFTELTKVSTILFNNKDIPILNHQTEDGSDIEPEYYAPIIPMILVNGTVGIGTGFSTKIPNFNPIDIINNLIRFIDENKYKSMKPFWNNFKGSVVKVDKNNFDVKGVYSVKNNKLIITELPVGEWSQNYKDFLEKMLDVESNKKDKSKVLLLKYKDNNTDENVHFELEFAKDKLEQMSSDEIEKTFHLVKKASLTNMHLYSINGSIKKYNSVKEIMIEYFGKRLELYDKRRDYQLSQLKYQLNVLSYKVKFILMVVENKLVVNNRKRAEIESDLVKHKFHKYGKSIDDTENKSYNYLLGMPIYTLTYEKIEELKKQMNEKEIEYNTLLDLTSSDIWKTELKTLLELLSKNK